LGLEKDKRKPEDGPSGFQVISAKAGKKYIIIIFTPFSGFLQGRR
jgi:hypothetical protein